MPDNRPRVETAKTINLAQLDAALDGHGLSGGDGVVVVVEGSPVTQQQLEDAVAAHEAEPVTDPQTEFLTAIDAATTLDELKAAIKGEGRPAMAAARGKPQT